MRRFRAFVAAVAVVGIMVSSAFAQQGTAGIGGRVTDEQGAVLPGVTLVMTNEATGTVREVTTSAEGTYLASQLVPGPYKVVARLEGFRTAERTGLILQVGTVMTITLELRVGGLEESVTVTGQSRWFERRSAPRYDYLVASRQKITRQMAKEAVARFKALGALRDWEHVAPELAKGLTGDASAGADLYWTPLDRRLLGLSTEGL